MRRLKFIEHMYPNRNIDKLFVESVFNEEEALAAALPIVIIKQSAGKLSWFICKSDCSVLASDDCDEFDNAEFSAIFARKLVICQLVANAPIPLELQKSKLTFPGTLIERKIILSGLC